MDSGPQTFVSVEAFEEFIVIYEIVIQKILARS